MVITISKVVHVTAECFVSYTTACLSRLKFMDCFSVVNHVDVTEQDLNLEHKKFTLYRCSLPPIGGRTWSKSFILIRFQMLLMMALSSSLACSKLPDSHKTQ